VLAIDFTFSGPEMVEELLSYTQRNNHAIKCNCKSKATSPDREKCEAWQQCNFEHGSAAGARANEPRSEQLSLACHWFRWHTGVQANTFFWTVFGANLRSHDNTSSLLKASALLSLKRYVDPESKRPDMHRGTRQLRLDIQENQYGER
jgi:hypothetical protein